jgi:tetratricopeptide (TPR) repeat protein
MRKVIGLITLHGLLLCSNLVSAASEEAAERIAAGKKLLEQGRVEAAIGEFQKASTIDPKYGAAQLNLGHAYERANRNDEAIDAYRKSIELEPRNFYARNNLGVLYSNKGMYDQAIVEFQDALKSDPRNAMALKNLEIAKKNKAAMQERETVIARAEKEVEAKPNDPTSAYQLARVYATYGKKETAIEWLGKAIEKGYKDFAYVKTDPAFTNLREERDFQLLLLRE